MQFDLVEEKLGAGTSGPFLLPNPVYDTYAFQASGGWSTGNIKLYGTNDPAGTWDLIDTINGTTSYKVVSFQTTHLWFKFEINGAANDMFMALTGIVQSRPNVSKMFTIPAGEAADSPIWLEAGNYHVIVSMSGSGDFGLNSFRWSSPPTNGFGVSVIGGNVTGVTSVDKHITVPTGLYRPISLTPGVAYTLHILPE